MDSLLLLALTVGLLLFGCLRAIPSLSPRTQIVTRYRATSEKAAPGPLVVRWLRQFPLTRYLPLDDFRLLQGALALGALVIVDAPWLLLRAPVSLVPLILYPSLAWLAPIAWLALMVYRRQRLLARGAADLAAYLCARLQAGAPLDQALQGASALLTEPLRGEVEELVSDLYLMELPAALQLFAARCSICAIHRLVQLLTTADRGGLALAVLLVTTRSPAWPRRM